MCAQLHLDRSSVKAHCSRLGESIPASHIPFPQRDFIYALPHELTRLTLTFLVLLLAHAERLDWHVFTTCCRLTVRGRSDTIHISLCASHFQETQERISLGYATYDCLCIHSLELVEGVRCIASVFE